MIFYRDNDFAVEGIGFFEAEGTAIQVLEAR